uniref:ORF2 n=1 Tax=Bamboo mosaic virus TaxID=35286 RepID=A0A0S2Z2A1_9VIRU|nr:ORF2 [Bamboo mosaic virus]ALQ32675.1 ORF2 [Bamboo mosaic virus]
MDNRITDLLTRSGYTRTSEPRGAGQQLVVHAVAGAGKTTLLREILNTIPGVTIHTAGTPDPPNLTLNYIRGQEPPCAKKYTILDEYPARAKWPEEAWDMLIADNLQHTGPTTRPHYIKHTTYRLGPQTVKALQNLGYQLEFQHRLDQQDQGFSFTGLFDGPIYGQPITLDTAAHNLALAHGLPALQATQTRGLEYDTTTIISSTPLSTVRDKVGLYIAFTRHRKACHIRAPGADPTREDLPAHGSTASSSQTT